MTLSERAAAEANELELALSLSMSAARHGAQQDAAADAEELELARVLSASLETAATEEAQREAIAALRGTSSACAATSGGENGAVRGRSSRPAVPARAGRRAGDAAGGRAERQEGGRAGAAGRRG